jgi:hypothetical protein
VPVVSPTQLLCGLLALGGASCASRVEPPHSDPRRTAPRRTPAHRVGLSASACLPRFPKVECTQVAKVWVTAGGLGFCLGILGQKEHPLCRLVDLGTGRYRVTHRRRPLTPVPKDDARLKPSAGGVKVCLGSAPCRRVVTTPKGGTPPRSDMALNPAGTRLAVVTGPSASTGRHVSVYDVLKGKRLWRKPAGGACADVRWLGDALLVNGTVCAGPEGHSWLADPETGKRRTWIGGKTQMNTCSQVALSVGGRNWAWVEIGGESIVIHNVGKASLVRTISLAQFAHRVAQDDETCEYAPPEILLVSGQRLAVVFTTPRSGQVVLFDLRTGRQIKHLKPKDCP